MQENLKKLYKEDFPLWVEKNYQLLKAGKYEEVDWENLYKEMRKLIQREVDEVACYLSLLLEKLYIWEHYEDLIENPRRHRAQIHYLQDTMELEIEKAPSIKQRLEEELDRAWNYARVRIKLWLEDMERHSEAINFFYTFLDCPYSLERALKA